MFRDIVLQDTRAEEWPAIRQRISARVAASMGKPPDVDVAPDHEVVKEYERYGLRHQSIRYRVMPDEDGLAVIVLPEGIGKGRRAHAVVVCHGTYGGQLGKDGPLSMEGPERGYAIELARRGFVTVTPDNYEFGERLTRGEDMPTAEVTRRYVQSMVRFLEQHPEWSLDGRRLWDHQRLLDVLDGLPFIQPRAYGVMGHSLGGRTAAFLAALDERIAVAVPSCGMSPNLTNVYRVASGHPAAKSSPEWIAHFQRTGGHMMYDYQDMIALCAPRPLLIVEPYNDAYNPYIEANFQCYAAGQRVYELLGKPECFRSLTHGDGHDTVDDVREFAYAWIKRWLRAG
jgi:dienelactone hydrolase